MSTQQSDEKVTVKRSLTKRASKKVRNLLKRARGKKEHHHDEDDEHLSSSMINTSTSNLSQQSSGGSLTTTDEDEFGSKTSVGSSNHSQPEKTADRSIPAPHDNYRSRKISTASNYEKYNSYDRQRASFDNQHARHPTTDPRKRTMSSPTSPRSPTTGVFNHHHHNSNNKQSSAIAVVPQTAVPSPPVSPTSLMMPASSASDDSVTTQSVEALSIASVPVRRNDDDDREASSVVLVPPTTNNTKESSLPMNQTAPSKEQSVKPFTVEHHEEVDENEKEENIITVDENSYVLASKPTTNTPTTSMPASTTDTTTTTSSNNNNPSSSSRTTTATTSTASTDMIIVGQEQVSKRVAYFDKKHCGKITMLDTFASLRGLGYHWMFAIPATLLMHLRLSPLTTPHQASTLRDWFSWPIYTERVAQALVHHTPYPRREHVTKWIDAYGHHKNSVRGLTFWDGFRALRGAERTTLRWWQFKLWLAHRLQWILTYSMLHDPQTRMVTQPALEYLCPAS